MVRRSNSTSATRQDGAEPSAATWDEMLLVGVVARARGTKGEVIVNATTDFPETRFAAGATVWGRPAAGGALEALTVAHVRSHLERPIVRFEGVTDMTGAERFAGWQLRVPEAAALELPEHVYYHHQLVGCEVCIADGTVVGTVSRVDGGGQSVRLVVAAARGEVLVPFVQTFCAVDLAARRIVVTPPEGLLDVNGAWRA
ncbi:MAG TPA: ribosome maturation factor RimM [Vicinamibacterales bacterium]|nr:ribosome maturation factor RimM [Vicinamibacterales bacterium]